MAKKKKIKLSACMIVKNEAAMLKRSLDSIQNLVDEIIVVDTGSTDETVEIAQTFNAKIFHYPWEHDFSKHRNQSILYATGDWILIIDADEAMDTTSTSPKALKQRLGKAGKKINAFSVTMADKNQDGEVVNRIKRERIFRNNAGMHYEGIVHNRPVYKGEPQPIDLTLFHYGYALSEDEMQARHARTVDLLERRIKQNPNDLHAFFYLSQLYTAMHQHDKGLESAQTCLTLFRTAYGEASNSLNKANKETQKSDEKRQNSLDFYAAIYHILAIGLIQNETYDEALTIVREGLEKLPHEIDLYYDLASIGFFTKNPDLVIEGGEAFLDQVQKRNTNRSATKVVPIQDHPTRPNSTTDPESIFSVKFRLMLAYLSQKRLENFDALWPECQIDWADTPPLHAVLLSALEAAQTWERLEIAYAYLTANAPDKIDLNEKTCLQYEIFIARKNEAEAPLEQAIEKYLNLAPNYEEVPLPTLIILAEALLKKNDTKGFLQLSAFLLTTHLTQKPESIKSSVKLAEAYGILADEQDETEQGKIITTLCSQIANCLSGSTEEQTDIIAHRSKNQNEDQSAVAFSELTHSKIFPKIQYDTSPHNCGLRISDGLPKIKSFNQIQSNQQKKGSLQSQMDIRGKKFIVIGGAGFIGSHLVDLLTKEDIAEIRIFDNFTRGNEENLAQSLKDPRVKIFELGGDLLHRDILNTAIKGMDGVFHLAALWLLHCHDFPRSAFEVNMGGTFNVLEAMLNNGVRRLVFSSSASVYGDAVEEPMTENHPHNNTNFYGATKIAGEQMCRALYHRYKDTDKFFNYTGLRYMNVYGPRQDYQGAYIAVIMKILDRLEQGLSPIVYGDGSQAYDFIYVKDCAQANIDAMKSNATDAFYNVGTGIKTSIKELTELLIELTDSEVEIQYEPAGLTFVKNRVGSPIKAENEIDFKSKIDLRAGLMNLIEWRKENKQAISPPHPHVRA